MPFRFRLWTLLALLSLVSWATLAPPGAHAQAQRDSSAVIAGLPFPDKVAGLVRGPTTTYPQAGYGFSVRYTGGRQSWADVYLYDKALDLTAPSKDALKIEMSAVLREILMVADARGVRNDTKVEATTLDGSMASARLRIGSDKAQILSFAFLTIAHGKFLKIRFSTRDLRTGRKQAETFRDATFKRIQSTKPVLQPKRDPRYI